MRASLLFAGGIGVLFLFTTSLPALAQDAASHSVKNRNVMLGIKKGMMNEGKKGMRKTDKAMKKVNAECMAVAVTSREDALIAAIQSRKTALIAAWSQEMDPRRSALKAAWEAWKGAKRAAWEAFRTATKACGENPKEESAGEAL